MVMWVGRSVSSVSAAYWRRWERRSSAGAGRCGRRSREVIYTTFEPRCMWCRMDAVWCSGVRGVGVVSVSGVYVDTYWYSRVAPLCRAVGMSREGLWCRSRVAYVVSK